MAKEKVYYHRVHGARFIMPDGGVLTFSAGDGSFRTDREDIQAELDKIANVPSSQVYTMAAPIIPSEEQAVHEELKAGAVTAFDGDKKIPEGAKTVPIPVAPSAKPTIIADPNLAEKAAAAAAAIAGNK